jgi:membrane-bound hydrogenase subunit mbhJ
MSLLLETSINIFHFNAASCGGCRSEIEDIFMPRYDVERLGFQLVNDIRIADCLLITGILNTKNLETIKKIQSQASAPIYVLSAGACAAGMGIMRYSNNCPGPVDKFLHVDIYLPGCPPDPQAIILSLLKLKDKIQGKIK